MAMPQARESKGKYVCLRNKKSRVTKLCFSYGGVGQSVCIIYDNKRIFIFLISKPLGNIKVVSTLIEAQTYFVEFWIE